MNPHPFRHMRLTMKLVQAQCALLLSVEGLGYTEQDYAVFFAYGELVHQFTNPTYKEYVGSLGAFLKFYEHLVDKIAPLGNDFEKNVRAEFVKVSSGYGDLIEE